MTSDQSVSAADALAARLPPWIFSRYRVERELGRGSMGVVYQATDRRLGRQVALKELHPSLMKSDGTDPTAGRFEREAVLLAKLLHPNIVTLFDISDQENRCFLVMEFVEGVTLRHYISEHSAVQWDKAIDWIGQAASGLSAAHEVGIVHRDIKPENLLIQPNGRLKIMDFGIALSAECTRYTDAGGMMGTPAYLAPELLDDAAHSEQSDLFALGIVFYEMLSGENPYPGNSVMEILRSVMTMRPIPIKNRCPDVPSPVSEVVDRLIQYDLNQRFRTANEVTAALSTATSLMQARGVPAPPTAPPAVAALSNHDDDTVLKSEDVRRELQSAMARGIEDEESEATILSQPEAAPAPAKPSERAATKGGAKGSSGGSRSARPSSAPGGAVVRREEPMVGARTPSIAVPRQREGQPGPAPLEVISLLHGPSDHGRLGGDFGAPTIAAPRPSVVRPDSVKSTYLPIVASPAPWRQRLGPVALGFGLVVITFGVFRLVIGMSESERVASRKPTVESAEIQRVKPEPEPKIEETTKALNPAESAVAVGNPGAVPGGFEPSLVAGEGSAPGVVGGVPEGEGGNVAAALLEAPSEAATTQSEGSPAKVGDSPAPDSKAPASKMASTTESKRPIDCVTFASQAEQLNCLKKAKRQGAASQKLNPAVVGTMRALAEAPTTREEAVRVISKIVRRDEMIEFARPWIVAEDKELQKMGANLVDKNAPAGDVALMYRRDLKDSACHIRRGAAQYFSTHYVADYFEDIKTGLDRATPVVRSTLRRVVTTPGTSCDYDAFADAHTFYSGQQNGETASRR